jgi:6-pyruvoyltetrahydropterin/6-carboxytetrahydropterin synthase
VLLRKTFRFEASHILPRHPGKCSRLHGHSWVLHVSIEGKINRDTGFVMDYADISKVMHPIIGALDHFHLNELIEYPSSEWVVVWIAKCLEGVAFPWFTIALEETCTSYCEISREEFNAASY